MAIDSSMHNCNVIQILIYTQQSLALHKHAHILRYTSYTIKKRCLRSSYVNQSPILPTIFHHNLNWMKVLFCCSSIPDHQIATKLYTCHGSICANFLAIDALQFGREQNDIFIKSELWLNNH